MRKVRRRPPAGELIAINAADPLNLAGIIVPGERVSVQTSNQLILRDGVPVAVRENRVVRYLGRLDEAAQWRVRNALIGHSPPLSETAH